MQRHLGEQKVHFMNEVTSYFYSSLIMELICWPIRVSFASISRIARFHVDSSFLLLSPLSFSLFIGMFANSISCAVSIHISLHHIQQWKWNVNYYLTQSWSPGRNAF